MITKAKPIKTAAKKTNQKKVPATVEQKKSNPKTIAQLKLQSRFTREDVKTILDSVFLRVNENTAPRILALENELGLNAE